MCPFLTSSVRERTEDRPFIILNNQGKQISRFTWSRRPFGCDRIERLASFINRVATVRGKQIVFPGQGNSKFYVSESQ